MDKYVINITVPDGYTGRIRNASLAMDSGLARKALSVWQVFKAIVRGNDY
jgi:hypothetical protein